MKKLIVLIILLLIFLPSLLLAGEIMLTWEQGSDPNSIIEAELIDGYNIYWDIIAKDEKWIKPFYSHCLPIENVLQHAMEIDPNQGIYYLYVTARAKSGLESESSNVVNTECPPCPHKLKIYLKKQ